MRLFSTLSLTAFGAALLASVSGAAAQDMPTITDYNIFLPKVIGQTCLENQDDKEIKCADLEPGDTGFVPVAQLEIRTHFSRDVLIQYCAKVEDLDFQELECQATVDGTVAAPGAQKPLEQVTGTTADGTATGVTIYNFCLAWFGQTTGRGKHAVDVECERKNDDEDTMVRIDSSTTSVFAR